MERSIFSKIIWPLKKTKLTPNPNLCHVKYVISKQTGTLDSISKISNCALSDRDGFFFSGTVYTGKQLPAGTASAYHAGVASTASIPVCSTLMFVFNLYHILNVK